MRDGELCLILVDAYLCGVIFASADRLETKAKPDTFDDIRQQILTFHQNWSFGGATRTSSEIGKPSFRPSVQLLTETPNS